MRILTIIAALAILTSASVPAMAAGSHVPAVCLDGTAPAGWLRSGGYCSIAAAGASTTSKRGSGCAGGLKYDSVAEVCVPE